MRRSSRLLAMALTILFLALAIAFAGVPTTITLWYPATDIVSGAAPRYMVNWEKEPFKSEPYDQALKQLYAYGKKYPINLGLNGVVDALGDAIQKVWHHDASMEAALAEGERLVNKAIADAAK